VFTDFFYFLRSHGLKISISEWLTFVEALEKGLHGSSLTGFYELARMILIKSESDFDRFDQAFLEFFQGIQSYEQLPQEIMDWLSDAKKQRAFDKAAVDSLFSGLDLKEIRRMLEERIKEQDVRHDGGNYWIGTGGTSLFGHSGYNPTGIRIGGAGRNRSAIQVASRREFQDFRRDTTLSIRQFQMAFRRLRQLNSQGEGPKDELQLEKTVRSTCENAGHLKLEFDRPRNNNVRLLLLFDSGGSMWPYAQLCGRLFHAAHQSNHFKMLRIFYFHNCIYERLFTTPGCLYGDSLPTESLLNALSPEWKVIFVGDGAMALSELTEKGGSIDYYHYNEQPGLYWIRRFTSRYPHLVWLNPLSEKSWPLVYGSWSIRLLQKELPMFPLTLDGLDAGLKRLMAAR
jgi:uncharacterized protein with von Willebrand factor type A (vWA) domain